LRDGLTLRLAGLLKHLPSDTAATLDKATFDSETAGMVKVRHGGFDGTIQWVDDRIGEKKQGTFTLVLTASRSQSDGSMAPREASELGACHPLRRETEKLVDIPSAARKLCDVEVTMPRFRIDQDLVSSEDYRICINAGTCVDEGTFLDREAAATTHTGAEQYCRWRGARLPNTREWYAASAGAHLPTDCDEKATPGCKVSAPSGVMLAIDRFEWLDEVDCDSHTTSRYVGLSSRGLEVQGPPLQKEALPRNGEFRCVRDN
jgi:formylglycine-generating enzyme required for sulfatase activity